jgi:uncharacterized protein (TIGR02300 family)
VVKPEWGVKRTCHHCGAKFYDMRREPVSCPKCGTVLDLEALAKPKRTRAAPPPEPKVVKPPPKRPPAEAELAEAGEELEAEVEKTKEEGEEVLEDTSELGEDEDDVAEVIEGVDEPPEDR